MGNSTYIDVKEVEKRENIFIQESCCPYDGGDIIKNPSYVHNKIGNPYKCKTCERDFTSSQLRKKGYKGGVDKDYEITMKVVRVKAKNKKHALDKFLKDTGNSFHNLEELFEGNSDIIAKLFNIKEI